MTSFKPFLRLSTARKFAGQRPIVRVGNTYLVPETDDMVAIGLTEITLLEGQDGTVGSVTLRHLNRLGNANHATGNSAYANSLIFKFGEAA